MNHTFTDYQIIDAKHAAARHMGRGLILRCDVQDIRALLNALPEPQDEWEQCRFEDIRKGDRVKKVATKAGTTVSHEGVAAERLGKYTKSWVNDQGLFVFDNHEFSDQTIHYYRIPAPVQHPDPLHDLTILVHGAYGNHYNNPTAYTSDGSAYNIVGLGDTRILPEDITEWEPAKVVPKEVADSD